MRYAIIEAGKVANIVEADAGFAAAQGWVEAGGAGIGWSYDGDEFSPPAVAPLPVPAVVSRFQARAALLAAELLSTIENAVAAYDGQDAAFVQLAWAEATEWKRSSPTVISLATLVGLTDQQLDDLFTVAAQIEA